jgi:hypothetical protein
MTDLRTHSVILCLTSISNETLELDTYNLVGIYSIKIPTCICKYVLKSVITSTALIQNQHLSNKFLTKIKRDNNNDTHSILELEIYVTEK